VLAFTPVELIITLIIALAIFIWGPSKIPELARALGKAKKEFEQAQKEFQAESSTKANVNVTENSQATLIEVATKLGIDTHGKSEEQIAREIVERVKRSS
jgi:sec-independent protein translocase protein TatA